MTPADDDGLAYPDWFGEFYYVLAYRLHPKYLRRRSRGTKYYHSQRVARPTQMHELSQTYVDLIPCAVSQFDHDLTTRVCRALSLGLDQASDGGVRPVYPLARLSPTDLIAQPKRGRRGRAGRPGGLYTQRVVVPLPYDRAEISGLAYVRTHRDVDRWVALPRDPSSGSVGFRPDARDRLGSNSEPIGGRVLRPTIERRRGRRPGAPRAPRRSGLPSRLVRARRPATGLSSTPVANRASGTGLKVRRTRWDRTYARGTFKRTPSAVLAPPLRTWSEQCPACVGLGENVMVTVRRRTVAHSPRERNHDRVVDVMRPVRGRGYGRGRMTFGDNADQPCLSWGGSKRTRGVVPGDIGSAERGRGFDGRDRYGRYACQTVVAGRYRSNTSRLTTPAGRHGGNRTHGRVRTRSTVRPKTEPERVVHDTPRRSTGLSPVMRAFGSWPKLRCGFARVRRLSYRRLKPTDTQRRVWPYLTVQVTHASTSKPPSVPTFPTRRDAYGRHFLLCRRCGTHERYQNQLRPLRVGQSVRKDRTVEVYVNGWPWKSRNGSATTWLRRRSRATVTGNVQIQRRVVRTRLAYDTGGSVCSGWAFRSKPSRTWCDGFQVPVHATVWPRRRPPKRVEVSAAEPWCHADGNPTTARPAARTWMAAGPVGVDAGGDASELGATKKPPAKVYDQPWPRYQPNLNLGRIASESTRSWRCAWVDRHSPRHVRSRPGRIAPESTRGVGRTGDIRLIHPVNDGVATRRDGPKTVQIVTQHRQSARPTSSRIGRTGHRGFGSFGSTVTTSLAGAFGSTRVWGFTRVGSGDTAKLRRGRRGRTVTIGVARRACALRNTDRTTWVRPRSPRQGASGFWAMAAGDYGFHVGFKPHNPKFVACHGVRSEIGHAQPLTAGDASGGVVDVGWTACDHSGWRDTLTPYAMAPSGRRRVALRDPPMPNGGPVVARAEGELVYGGSSRKPRVVACMPRPWPVNGRSADELRYLTTACVIHYRHDAARTNLTVGGYVHVQSQLDGNRRNRTAGQVLTVSGTRVTLRRGRHYRVPTHSRCDVNGDAWVERGQGLMAVRYRNLMTGDIVQGIPKVERVFEARINNGLASLPALLTRIYDRFDFNTPRRAHLREAVVSRSVQSVVRFALNSVQGVYQSQGVNIADKHVEIILRQMTAKVSITYPGDSGLLFGDLVYVAWIRHLMPNRHRGERDGPSRGPRYRPPLYVPCIHGITKTALGAQGFLAAASFQETTRILAQAAVAGRRDFLRGLKGNVILGARLPMGTGMMSWRMHPDPGTTRVDQCDPYAPKRFSRVGVLPTGTTARGRRLRTPDTVTTQRRRSTAGAGRPASRGRRPGSRRLDRVFDPPIVAAFGLAAEPSRLLRSTNLRAGFAGPNPGPSLPTTPRITRLRYGRLRLLRRLGYRRLYRTAICRGYLALGLKPRDLGDRARPAPRRGRRRPRRRPRAAVGTT